MKALLFPGQGSQDIGMGKSLYLNSIAARDVFDEVDEILNGEVVIDPIPDTGPIDIDTMSGGTRRPIAPTMTADELI